MKQIISPLFMLLMVTLSACSSAPRKQNHEARAFSGGRTVAWQSPVGRNPRKKTRIANLEYKRRLKVATARNEAFRPVW